MVFFALGIRVNLSHPKGGGGDKAIKWNGLRSIPYVDKRWKTYRSSRASTLPLSPLSPPAQILLADKAFKCITQKIIKSGESIQRNGGSTTFGSVHTPPWSLPYSSPAEQVMNVLVRSGPIKNRNQKIWVPFLLRRINYGTFCFDATVLACRAEPFDRLRQNPYLSAFTARLEFFLSSDDQKERSL